MAYETLKFKITGVSPLLMHNGQLADPLNSFAKSIAEISSKRKKTDADHIEMGRREFYGSLYMSGGRPCIPGEMLEAVMIAGAKKEKRGPQAKAGLLVDGNATLLYDGPTTAEELWADERFRLRVPVKVGMAKVMRTRPRFDGWSADIEVKFLPSMLNAREVKSFLQAAGEQVGIGDWRPRFGRFEVA
ncbi:hypothetical protein M5E06_17905 [Azospirillum sp. A1-3]|uniref:hypothetical protein n=1 Tax=Azospirillum sp. A1-3 TaxID=185874 RepID=UPI0020777812|nr:hypothetical protein [Azospirillum sp. A1-3]MCM8736011.1 hypothetical protein [Azospirillum sp. A1-3]